jgi:hypothetical protein
MKERMEKQEDWRYSKPVKEKWKSLKEKEGNTKEGRHSACVEQNSSTSQSLSLWHSTSPLLSTSAAGATHTPHSSVSAKGIVNKRKRERKSESEKEREKREREREKERKSITSDVAILRSALGISLQKNRMTHSPPSCGRDLSSFHMLTLSTSIYFSPLPSSPSPSPSFSLSLPFASSSHHLHLHLLHTPS